MPTQKQIQMGIFVKLSIQLCTKQGYWGKIFEPKTKLP